MEPTGLGVLTLCQPQHCEMMKMQEGARSRTSFDPPNQWTSGETEAQSDWKQIQENGIPSGVDSAGEVRCGLNLPLSALLRLCGGKVFTNPLRKLPFCPSPVSSGFQLSKYYELTRQQAVISGLLP